MACLRVGDGLRVGFAALGFGEICDIMIHMKIRHQIIVALILAVAFGVCGCMSGRELVYDETFRYMCTSRVGPITCGATNIVDAINTLFKEGNASLSSNGCPHGISVLYHPEGEEDRTTADSVTLPPCPIHDACMMVAHHYIAPGANMAFAIPPR